jgi:uncharacterized protein (TIGR02145 family)
VIFCTECDELEVYNGTIWKSMAGTAACVSPSFPGVTICNQVWMQKNLDVSKYRNGDDIPQVTDPLVWPTLTTGAWCWYNNDSATYAATYGKLYNFEAVRDPRGLAPQGWHIPTDAEWTSLGTCLGGDAVAGGKLKEPGITHWLAPNTGSSNSSGWTALAGGMRTTGGVFDNLNLTGRFWSSLSAGPGGCCGFSRLISYSNSILQQWSESKGYGISVRCLRD